MFDVYVVGATEPGEEGLDKLAEGMSGRYGLPLEDLRGRLARGRFRVKANVDRATAEAYAKDMALVGGRCSIEDAATGPGQSVPPPIAVPTPARTTTPPAGIYQSGLSAAFSGNAIPAADLGALGGAEFSLSSLDGHDAAPARSAPAPASFAPPGTSAAPMTPPLAAPKPPRPRETPVELPDPYAPGAHGIPVDPFRPPDAADDDRPVEIAADEIEHRARKRMSTPPASAPVVAAPPISRRSSPSIPAATAPARSVPEAVAIVRPRGRLGYLGDERARFAIGVVLAILIGFVPAHLVASMRERGAYHAIDATVESQQAAVAGQEDWDALDAFRARQLDDKRAARRSIALLALLVWGAVGGGVAYGFFRRIPWDDLDAPRTA